MYAIFRGTFSWRVQINRAGQIYQNDFYFTLGGGVDNALLLATAYRDELLRQHPPPARRVAATNLRSDNTSGIPGVTATRDKKGKVMFWVARTRIGPRAQLAVAFSVSKWGDKARAQAVAERELQLKQLVGLKRTHPAEESLRNAPVQPLPAGVVAPILRDVVLRRHNESGTSGVQLLMWPDGRPRCWTARLIVPRGTRSFSVNLYGYEEAKALAVAERLRHVALKAALSP